MMQIANFRLFRPGNSLALLIFTLFLSSCSTYTATVKKHEELRYEAVRVYPAWTYQEPKKKKWITPVIGLGAATTYGYNHTTTIEDKTYTGYKNAAIWGIGGLVAGHLLNGILFPKRNPSKTRFDISQSEKWIKNYNKSTNSDYLIKEKEMNNSLILVSSSKIIELRNSIRLLHVDLEKTSPNTSFEDIPHWRSKLAGKYSILPKIEVNATKNLLAQHEEKIANRDLISKVNTFKSLSNEYPTIHKILSFKRSTTSLYNAASFATQQTADDIMNNKLSVVFEKLMEDEFIKLNGIAEDLNNIGGFDSFYSSFDSKYSIYKSRPEVYNMYSQIINKKTSIISKHIESVSRSIELADHQNRLTTIENAYLNNVDVEELSIQKLANELRSRRLELRAESKRQDLAEKRRLEKLKAERRVAMNSMTPKQQAYFLNELDFSAEGLEHEQVIKNIYLGNFEAIPYDRDELAFSTLIGSYITAYAHICARSIPAENRVELTEQVCETWEVTRYGYSEVSRCIRYRTEGLNLYAKPEMYQAKVKVNYLYINNALGDIFKVFTAGNPFSVFSDMTYEAISMKSDMEQLIRSHGCGSPALLRFEENLRAFANNDNPLIIASTWKEKIQEEPIVISKHQNYDKLIEDLIQSDSRKWTLNRYQKDSAYGFKIIGKDELGRPTVMMAHYRFTGWAGLETGSVRVVFEDGIPDCLYFFDLPDICKTANRRIIAKYKKGEYQN